MRLTNNEIIKSFSNSIDRYVRPDSFPLAVRMVDKSESLPEKTKRPKETLNEEIAICQLFSIARKYGWQLALGEDDLACPLALTAFGFKPKTDSYLCGEMCAGMYTSDKTAGTNSEAEVPKFSFDKYKYILTAPISRADFQPHLYLIYGNSAQVMRLLAGYLWKDGGRLTSHFSARIDCADICIETMNTKKAQVILPCYGDRVFGQTQDHEMAFTIPAGVEQDVIDGLEGTHKGGIRYPIPSYLRYKPQFPKHYYNLFNEWKG